MSFSNIQGFDNVLHASADTLAKNILESADLDDAVKKINDIVNQVLDQSSYSAAEISEAKRLLSKIEAVNQKIVNETHRSPFKTAVQRLHARFDETRRTERSPSPPPAQLPPSAQLPPPARLPPPAQSKFNPPESPRKPKHPFEK